MSAPLADGDGDDPTAPQAPFDIAPDVAGGDDAGSLRITDFERHYEGLFAEALEAGEISPGERQRLDLAAQALGLDPARVGALERALLDAWESGAAPTLAARAAALAERVQPPSVAPGRPDDDDEPPTLARPRTSTKPAPAPLAPSEALHARFAAADPSADHDEAWRLADVLMRRGEATDAERELWERFKVPGPVRPRHSLTVEAWDALLTHPGEDRTASALFAAMAPAALLARIAAMRRDGTLPRVTPDRIHDARSTTVSAVRALAWAAATLGLRAPPCVLAPEEDAGLEVLCAMPPATRIGAQALSGWSASKLAFMCGRHLSWFREQHFICTLVPDVSYLEAIFYAALMLGAPRVALPEPVREHARAFAQVIVPCLEPADLERLRALVEGFVARGGRVNLRRWARAAEWTGCRAGLLLCGEIAVAAGAIAAEPGGESRVEGLEAFWVSPEAGDLRRRLGVALT